MIRNYRWPPIVEAAIELRVREQLEMAVVEKLKDKFLEQYPLPPQTNLNLDFQFGPDSAQIRQQIHGYRLTSLDGADVLLLNSSGIVTSRFAPYRGWEDFIGRARTNFAAWRRTVGQQTLTRIGIRYINRIDLPNQEDVPVNLENYFKIIPRLPDSLTRPLQTFATNVTTLVGDGDIGLNLNFSTDNNVLVKTNSFLLDIDLSKNGDLPQKDSDIWDCVGRFREIKNSVFETCITDQTRGMFGP